MDSSGQEDIIYKPSENLHGQEQAEVIMHKFSYIIRSSISSSAAYRNPRTFPILGVIFDLDGTLTMPVLDFKYLKKIIECPLSNDILSFIRSKPEKEKTRLLKIVEEFEDEGNKNMKLRPGVRSLLRFLADNGLRRAVVTRNAKPCVDVFLNKLGEPQDYGGPFSHLLTRDFTPSKPDPAPIHHICKEWKLAPSNVIMVGDHLHDITCGLDAGSVTILINHDKNGDYKPTADFNVDSLEEMISLMKTNSMAVERPE